ncbi:dual specificity protein phosphatase family protein [bacterium]|nr:dual specificity protein phosphatase family protein [bacterium]
METPYPRSWWVIPGKLLAGCAPSEAHLELLVDAGIRAIVCLQESVWYEEALDSVSQRHGVAVSLMGFSIPDGHAPSRETMNTVLDVIDGFLGQGRPVYVHCAGGHGRTGTVVGCWLVRHHKSGDEALEHIRRLRSACPELRGVPSPETSAQLRMVRNWGGGAQEAPKRRSASAFDPVGTSDAVDFMRRRGMISATKDESAEFQYDLGEQRTSHKGELRTVIGYAFDPRGKPRYIVEMAYGNIGSKLAEKAHRQYGKAIGNRLGTLGRLITRGEAQGE